jgi:hypothetical protein
MDEEKPPKRRDDAWARSEARRVFNEWFNKRLPSGGNNSSGKFPNNE